MTIADLFFTLATIAILFAVAAVILGILEWIDSLPIDEEPVDYEIHHGRWM